MMELGLYEQIITGLFESKLEQMNNLNYYIEDQADK